MTVLTVGSLCTGYGGLDLAVSAVLGTRLAWVADNDPGATAILAHHYPQVPNLGDITALDWATVPPVDVLTAGFPCQDLSYAGRGAGIKEGTRSGLWLTIARAVRTLRPRLLVLENVRAIVARRPGLDVVLADLARLGFDAEWTCVRASDVGAPHRRARWFLLAWPAEPADAQGTRLQGQGLPRRPADGGGTLADPDGQRGHRDRTRSTRRDEPAPHRVPVTDAAGIGTGEPPDQTLTLTTGGHARPVPGRRGRDAVSDATSNGRHQRRAEPEGQLGRLDVALDGAPAVEWGAYAPAIRRWETITATAAPRPTDDRGRLGAVFVEWLMGLSPGWVTGVPGLTRNQMLHALGNGVVPGQATAALHALLPDHLTPTWRDAA